MRITWSEPQIDGKWGHVARKLRASPGKWAKMGPAGTFEARVINGELWVRYVGHLFDRHDDYLSSACFHGRHDQCGSSGCEFCGSRCICTCHDTEET